MVVVVYDEVHARKADDFMELVASFVYDPVTRHERPRFIAPFLHGLNQQPAFGRDFGRR